MEARRLGVLDKTYVLTVAGAPKSVNSGGGGVRVAHWSVAYKEKKLWEGKYLMELLAAKVPKVMQFCTVRVTVRFKHQNHAETHNYFQPVYKPLLDALVKGGYLADDSDEYVAVHPLSFEYPEEWGYRDPRVKSELIIQLEASYL